MHLPPLQATTPASTPPGPQAGDLQVRAPWPARSHTELHGELHARPALPVPVPGVVSYWVQWRMDPPEALRLLGLLCSACEKPQPAAEVRHHVLVTPEFHLKFERHGEFVSWQVSRPLALGQMPDDDAVLDALLQEVRAIDVLPSGFVQAMGEAGATPMLAATHVVLLPGDSDAALPRCRRRMHAMLTSTGARDDGAALIGSRVADDRALVLTDLRLRRDGFTRFVLIDLGLPPDQAAREAQRLCEIEAYRMLAMLGFPVAQAEAATLRRLEEGLQQIVDAMANDEAHDDAAAFHLLTRMAADTEHVAARTRYRFSATRAYHQIVQRRLADLREGRIEGVQTLSGFFGRRFAPAMALCDSTDARLTDIAERINRAVSLAQVRVETQREATNQALLEALAHRQQQQLRLQQAVEGLSVVAISYYVLGLFGYVAKATEGLEVLGWTVKAGVVVGAAVLPVLGGVAWGVRRLRRHLVER